MDDGEFVDRTAAHQTTLVELINKYLKEVTPGYKGAAQERQRLEQMKQCRFAQHAAAKVKNTDFAEWRDDRLQQVSQAQ